MTQFADLNLIYRSLGNIESTLKSIEENMSVGRARMDTHDRQIAGIHQKINWGSGLVTAFGLILGWFGKQFVGGGSGPL